MIMIASFILVVSSRNYRQTKFMNRTVKKIGRKANRIGKAFVEQFD